MFIYQTTINHNILIIFEQISLIRSESSAQIADECQKVGTYLHAPQEFFLYFFLSAVKTQNLHQFYVDRDRSRASQFNVCQELNLSFGLIVSG